MAINQKFSITYIVVLKIYRFKKFPGDHSVEATPVPIPNTEVKLYRADDTAGVTLWESRSLPGLFFAQNQPRGGLDSEQSNLGARIFRA